MKRFVSRKGTHRPISTWMHRVPLQRNAFRQAVDTARLPFVHPMGMALMPDAHWGIGATVGSVVPTVGAIVPAAVGVDIGCGMIARRLDLTSHDLPECMDGIQHAIEAAVPVGRAAHKEPVQDLLHANRGMAVIQTAGLWVAKQDPYQQCGTLGGGNHFIEVCLDEDDQVWIMLHSGSRGVGNRVGRHFIELAKRECEKWHVPLPNDDLAYLPEDTPMFQDYVDAVEWCQEYARVNRRIMMRLVHDAMEDELGRAVTAGIREVISCHHNYVARENHFGRNCWVTRKGAVRAREGDLGIIPGAMGKRSFIVRGKGNAFSFHSCSHGAGRLMGRKEAERRFTVEQLREDTEGVACRKDEAVLDEIPRAYKPLDAVMAAQADLVDVVHELRAVACVKGGEK